ncbi:RNA-dependent RNA polymerase [Vanilla virus X]|uniref:RNA replication protein n=1 Tax=Vanilla virus X TaxID=2016427 RepID=A0A220NQ59_9VIRU|nr:RNA-dependent RNA polymerase [Vanilla virus X]ASJ78784.1 RNA-dependent RNA polymerase [Vanilla virus X]
MANIRAALDRFTDTSIKSALQEQAYSDVKPELRAINSLNPYAQSTSGADDLEQLGIGTNPFSIKLHTHAAAKAVENRMLEIVGHHLPRDSCTFLWLKKAKLNLLRRNNPLDTFRNVPFEPKDFARYEEETICSSINGITDATVYISDALHFMKPSFVLGLFAGNPSIQQVYATLVLPPEALHKHPSAHPNLYNINYNFGGFQYIPGKHAGGAYHHELETLEWLKIGKIFYNKGLTDQKVITVQLLESLGANHLFLFRRGDWVTPRVRTFSLDEYVTLPQIFHPKLANASRPIRFTLANQLLLYVKSIKTATQRDIFAKLRQLIKTEDLSRYAPDELVHIANYFLFVGELSAENCYDNLLKMGFFRKCTVPIKNAFLKLWRTLFGKLEFEQLLQSLEWKPFSYSLLVIDREYNDYTVRVEARKEKYHKLNSQFHSTWAIEDTEADIDDLVTRMTTELHIPLPLPSPNDDGQKGNSEEAKTQPEAPMPAAEKGPTDDTSSPFAGGEEEPSNIADDHERVNSSCEASTSQNAPAHPGTSKERTVRNAYFLHAMRKAASDPNVFTDINDAILGACEKMERSGCVDSPWSPWASILNACGFSGDYIQHDQRYNLIYPIQDIKAVNQCPWPITVPTRLAAALEKMGRPATHAKIESRRAAAFASDVKNSRTGMLLPKQPIDWKQAFASKCDFADTKNFPCVVIHGAGGSGKSRLIQNFLKTVDRRERRFCVVTPTLELRNDWLKKVPQLPLEVFKTFEKAMVQGSASIVIMDDYTKLPAGYIEAYIMQHPNVDLLILTGDPKQSSHHEQNSQAQISHLEPAHTIFGQYAKYYINATHRNCSELANPLGVYSENFLPLKLALSSQVSDGPILVPSQLKSEALHELGRKAYTYAGCQGLTTPSIQIMLDQNTPLCSNEVIYTALSRAVDEITFINTGSNSTDFWRKMDCTPYLKTFLQAVREPKLPTEKCEDPQPREPIIKTHFPVENEKVIFEKEISELQDKFSRELHTPAHGHSNAIQTEDTIVQLFQHQQAKDQTLYWATIDKRIKLATEEANLKEFVFKKDIGDILFLNYKEAMNLPNQPIPFDLQLYENCKSEVQNTYLKKPISQLMNGELRQSPDFHPHAIQLFLKSQWVKKNDCIGLLQVKAGQTIASFMQQTVMIFGTMARYMRRMRQRYQPRKIMINCETTPEDISKFLKQEWNFKRPAYANDYSAFDQSQDGAMLQFEVIKAKYHCIPEEIIDAYIAIKLNAKIFLGTLAIMRLTGEGPTFDANTECNIAYHFARFNMPPDTAYLFAGDDMAQDAPVEEKSSFAKIKDRLSLTSKPLTFKQGPGDYASFCGSLITPLGLLKEARKLAASLELANRTGNLKNVAASYAQDIFPTFVQGDRIYDIFTPEEQTHHRNSVRFLVKSAHQNFGELVAQKLAGDSDSDDEDTGDSLMKHLS